MNNIRKLCDKTLFLKLTNEHTKSLARKSLDELEELEKKASRVDELEKELQGVQEEFVPKAGDRVYFVDYNIVGGWDWVTSITSSVLNRLKSRGTTFYKTQEEVEARVKELGW